MTKYLSLLLFILFRSLAANAQQKSIIPPSALGVHLFYDIFKNPLATDGRAYKTGVAGLAISYQKGISHSFTFSSSVSGSIQDFTNRDNINLGNGNKQFLLELDASGRYLLLADRQTVKPFIQAGIGGSYYNSYLAAYFPFGIGCQIHLTTSSFILLQAQKRIALSGNQDDHYYLTIGLAGIIGRQKTIRQNKQVAIPPKDSDGDGIFDSSDACPLVPGFLKYHGCPIPDRDGDGINDEEDSCPDVPGALRYAGCPIPDRDKDGINDEADQCPDIFGVIRYQGCPIPDLDGDGLNDEVDDCPAIPGPVSNKGCPILNQELINKVIQAARNIFFATGKFELLPKSYVALNEVINILKIETTLDLMIEGHTDNSGNARANFVLSENRAKSVMTYLMDHGISIRRLRAKGYAATRPIDSNMTVIGRANNRRVEMKLSFTKFSNK